MLQTVTLQPATVILRMPKEPIINCLQGVIDGVGKDFLKLFQDNLSVRLYNWSKEMIQDPDLKNVRENQEFIHKTKDRLRYMVFDLTRDFFTEKRLAEPVLVVQTGWVCEKRLFENCEHGKPLNAVPHLFAEAMLNWAKLLIIPDNDALVRLNTLSDNYSAYRTMVQAEYADFILASFIEEAKNESVLLKKMMEFISVYTKELLKEAETEAQASTEALKSEINDFKKMMDEKVQSLLALAAELKKQVAAAEKEREGLYAASSAQQQAIDSLRQQLYQKIQEVEWLKRQAREKGSSCTLI